MLDIVTLLLFVPTCFALNIIPGPNNLMAMNNAQRYGFKIAIFAGFGRLIAFCFMIFLAALGLATVLHTSEKLFFAIKVLGALYLFWIAIQLWRADVQIIVEQSQLKKTVIQLTKQELLMAAGNPKAILIFTAFLPQFINPSYSTNQQFLILGVIFILLELLAIMTYALFGLFLKNWFSKPAMRQLFNRGCALLIGSLGIGLLLERKT